MEIVFCVFSYKLKENQFPNGSSGPGLGIIKQFKLSSSDLFHITRLTACSRLIDLAIVALKSYIVTFYRCYINTGDIWLQLTKQNISPDGAAIQK